MKDAQEPEPFQWPRPGGLLPAWMLRRYADWLFPQLQVTWAARSVYTYVINRMDRKSPDVPEYQFPRSRGLCRMSDLIHFGKFCEEQTQPLVQKLEVIEPDNPTFREELTGPILPQNSPEKFQWARQRGLARVSDLRRLDAFLRPRLKARAKPKREYTEVTL